MKVDRSRKERKRIGFLVARSEAPILERDVISRYSEENGAVRVPGDFTGSRHLPIEPQWERIAEARARVMAGTGCSTEKAQRDICRAVAGGVVRVRAQVGRHAGTELPGGTTLESEHFEVPPDLRPEDLDWERSRPLEAWMVPRRPGRPTTPGHWYLEWIELRSSDISDHLCISGQERASVEPSIQAGVATRSPPAREQAKRAIDELYPQGVPPPAVLRNQDLCYRVQKKCGKWAILLFLTTRF